MKNIILLLVCLLSLDLMAQKDKVKFNPTHDEDPLHFGFSIGLNTMDFNIKQSAEAVRLGILPDLVTLRPGFQVHAISNFRLGKYFDFRMLPGISFGGEREISYVKLSGDTVGGIEDAVNIESNFLEMPFLIKYKAKRINNFRPFLIGGATLRFDLAATKKTWGVSKKGTSLVLLNVFDCYYEIGFGTDFYLENFKFTLELKYAVGVTDVLKRSLRDKGDGPVVPPDEYAVYTNVIDRLNSRMFMVSFHFE
ncbi:MAG: PorT family protein [Bacteroidales bacterium]|nr:PorT family protein [Bacteroidales bacterium]